MDPVSKAHSKLVNQIETAANSRALGVPVEISVMERPRFVATRGTSVWKNAHEERAHHLAADFYPAKTPRAIRK